MSLALYCRELDPRIDPDAPEFLKRTAPVVRAYNWRRWARAVRRHQRQLMASLAQELNQAHEEQPPHWLPWTLEDLATKRKPPRAVMYTSPYYGVVAAISANRGGFFAYRPATDRRSRKPLGWFPDQDSAGWAVVKALNPNAVIPSAPLEDIP